MQEQWGSDCQKVKNNLRTTPGWMQAIKKILMTIWQLFKTEMLKQKYIHSILKQNKLNTINIKFKFRIIELLLMDENMDSINMEKNGYF